MSIKVLKAGLQTTIQDLGRQGFREYGIAQNGALDQYSHCLANWLVGKSKHEPTIEITQVGPTLEFTQAMTLGIAGAEFELFINDEPCSANQTLQLTQGDILNFGKLKSGARAYLAFSDKLKVSPLMDSQSTNLLAGFGGYQGRALKDNDLLQVEAGISKELRTIPEELQQELHHNLQQKHIIVRITEGRELSQLTASGQAHLYQTNYKVTSHSNRMAVKLESNASLTTDKSLSITTVPIVAGTIQLPPNGQPIITLADGQTTGGYPRIGQVISADLSLLAQLKTGDSLSFYPVSVEQALSALIKKNEYIESALAQVD